MGVRDGVFLVGMILTATATLAAHHAVDETFDTSRVVTLNGVIGRVEWVNPHARMFLDVTRGDGTTAIWSIELPPPNSLRQRGFDAGAIKQGDRVVVDAWPARDGSQLGSVRAIRLSDGRTFSNGPAMWTRQSNR